MSPQFIFDFNKDSVINDWRILDDVVMGGRSSGQIYLNNEGHGVFKGNVSLKNNGGFSSVRYTPETVKSTNYSKVVLRIKGDGKNYQFRVKSDAQDYYSYVAPFSTTGEWQSIEIPFNTMYPSFRGRKLDQSNFPGKQIEEIAFLIGNKKEQSFELLIDSIELK